MQRSANPLVSALSQLPEDPKEREKMIAEFARMLESSDVRNIISNQKNTIITWCEYDKEHVQEIIQEKLDKKEGEPNQVEQIWEKLQGISLDYPEDILFEYLDESLSQAIDELID